MLIGTLTYDSHQVLTFDDRTLFHLQGVIGAKLRRREPFYFTSAQVDGAGTTSVWIDCTISLRFDYDEDSPHRYNREWVEILTALASSTGGLRVAEEPTPV